MRIVRALSETAQAAFERSRIIRVVSAIRTYAPHAQSRRLSDQCQRGAHAKICLHENHASKQRLASLVRLTSTSNVGISICEMECATAKMRGNVWTWTHWDLSPGPSACEADVMPLHHAPLPVTRFSIKVNPARPQLGGFLLYFKTN